MAGGEATIGRYIHDLIAEGGPITVERFMALCLAGPGGYYATRDPFGAAGDFTTAPEISQMFGELIGLWVAAVWRQLGAPAHLRLVELGPGRGTLMADALRALSVVPDCRSAIHVALVETSPALRAFQQATLSGFDGPLHWHDRIDEVPSGPAVVIGNEILDALPIRQFVHDGSSWRERLVGLAEGGDLTFGLSARRARIDPAAEAGVPLPGSVFEIGEEAAALVGAVARRLVREGGAALFVDYGHVRSGYGETLQAVRRHRFVPVLDASGEADLTAHVDFEAMGRVARLAGARVATPLSQREFLLALGLAERAGKLAGAQTDPAQAAVVESAYARLIDDTPTGMGRLFKVLVFGDPALGPLPAFD